MKLREGDFKVGSDVQLEWMERLVEIRDAAKALAARLREIEASPAYQAVWPVAQDRVGPYSGPTWKQPLGALEALLAKGGG